MVRYFDCFQQDEKLHIVTEYCNKRDLERTINNVRSKNYKFVIPEKIWTIFVSVALGKSYIYIYIYINTYIYTHHIHTYTFTSIHTSLYTKLMNK